LRAHPTEVTNILIVPTDPSPPPHHPLPLHDALPIPAMNHVARTRHAASQPQQSGFRILDFGFWICDRRAAGGSRPLAGRKSKIRSEEQTAEFQSREKLVWRLLVEKKKH